MKNQNKVFFFIGLIVMITIAIQFYWNAIQYRDNKQQMVNEIQIVLDNAIDTYYNELSKQTSFRIYYHQDTTAIETGVDYTEHNQAIIDRDLNPEKFEVFPEYTNNGMLNIIDIHKRSTSSFIESGKKLKSVLVFRGKKELDSIRNKKFTNYFPGMSWHTPHDSVYFSQFKPMLDTELERKNFHFDYFFVQKDSVQNPIDSLGTADSIRFPFMAVSHSVLLPESGSMELHYPNIFWITLKKGTMGIVLSMVLSGTVIFSLFYLLRIIRKQKQLSEIKNDFISNITHELKTPIATVTSAVEGMRNFNEDNNPEKNQKYLDVSAQQLDKLKILVEKIMETSVLESKDLILEKENADIIGLIKNAVEKHRLNTQKTIVFESDTEAFIFYTDAFHFENALSNLIENAVKYGGNEIIIRFFKNENKAIIEVADNGAGIPKEHQKMIFDKFYRIPNKNKHNVKGFGIGLYYTKNIIEKHNGIIELKSEKNTTVFRVVL